MGLRGVCAASWQEGSEWFEGGATCRILERGYRAQHAGFGVAAFLRGPNSGPTVAQQWTVAPTVAQQWPNSGQWPQQWPNSGPTVDSGPDSGQWP